MNLNVQQRNEIIGITQNTLNALKQAVEQITAGRTLARQCAYAERAGPPPTSQSGRLTESEWDKVEEDMERYLAEQILQLIPPDLAIKYADEINYAELHFSNDNDGSTWSTNKWIDNNNKSLLSPPSSSSSLLLNQTVTAMPSATPIPSAAAGNGRKSIGVKRGPPLTDDSIGTPRLNAIVEDMPNGGTLFRRVYDLTGNSSIGGGPGSSFLTSGTKGGISSTPLPGNRSEGIPRPVPTPVAPPVPTGSRVKSLISQFEAATPKRITGSRSSSEVVEVRVSRGSTPPTSRGASAQRSGGLLPAAIPASVQLWSAKRDAARHMALIEEEDLASEENNLCRITGTPSFIAKEKPADKPEKPSPTAERGDTSSDDECLNRMCASADPIGIFRQQKKETVKNLLLHATTKKFEDCSGEVVPVKFAEANIEDSDRREKQQDQPSKEEVVDKEESNETTKRKSIADFLSTVKPPLPKDAPVITTAAAPVKTIAAPVLNKENRPPALKLLKLKSSIPRLLSSGTREPKTLGSIVRNSNKRGPSTTAPSNLKALTETVNGISDNNNNSSPLIARTPKATAKVQRMHRRLKPLPPKNWNDQADLSDEEGIPPDGRRRGLKAASWAKDATTWHALVRQQQDINPRTIFGCGSREADFRDLFQTPDFKRAEVELKHRRVPNGQADLTSYDARKDRCRKWNADKRHCGFGPHDGVPLTAVRQFLTKVGQVRDVSHLVWDDWSICSGDCQHDSVVRQPWYQKVETSPSKEASTIRRCGSPLPSARCLDGLELPLEEEENTAQRRQPDSLYRGIFCTTTLLGLPSLAPSKEAPSKEPTHIFQ